MNEKLNDALDHISDQHIAEAAAPKKRRGWLLPAAVAAVLALVILAASLIGPLAPAQNVKLPGVHTAMLLAAPVYPALIQYPTDYDAESQNSWWEQQRALHNQPEGYADSLEPYFAAITNTLLADANGGNAVCSPVNIYMALAMLAETTDGNSRQQILDLLGADSIKDLRTQAEQVWRAHYNDDGLTTSILANSLWLEEGYNYNNKTVDLLADKYYASVFQGDLGSEEVNEALRSWINSQTGGLLQEQTKDLKMDARSVLALASTLYYRVQWQDQFQERHNTDATFHGADGDSTEEFMNKTLIYNPYYWGDNFGAVYLNLEDDGRMWLILPDEGVTPEELLSSGEVTTFLQQNSYGYKNKKSLMVHLSVPKFDISSDMELTQQLKKLGITDIFLPGTADFSPIIPENDGGCVDQVKHAARVAIDEEGVTAAAFTVIMRAGAGMPPSDEMDFVLDRPFLFVIESQDGLPLFAGVVNQP